MRANLSLDVQAIDERHVIDSLGEVVTKEVLLNELTVGVDERTLDTRIAELHLPLDADVFDDVQIALEGITILRVLFDCRVEAFRGSINRMTDLVTLEQVEQVLIEARE